MTVYSTEKTVMPATPDDLYKRLAALQIEVVTYNHPPLHTVEESRRLRGNIPGAHCKSLFLRTKKKIPWLVVTLEHRHVSLKNLAKTLGGGSLSFGSPERLMEYLGVLPGSVTPFALINDPGCQVHVVLDQDMLTYNPLNYHPLINTATVAIAPHDLLRFVDACGHEPRIIDLSATGCKG